MLKISLWAAFVGFAASQQLARDPCVGGVEAEIVHLYYDEYPQGTTETYIFPSLPLWVLTRNKVLLYQPMADVSRTTLARLTLTTSPILLQN